MNSIIYSVLTLQADSVPPPTQMCVERMLWKSHRQLQSEFVKTLICTCCKTSATPPSAVIKGYIKHPFVKCVVKILWIFEIRLWIIFRKILSVPYISYHCWFDTIKHLVRTFLCLLLHLFRKCYITISTKPWSFSRM